MSEYSSTHLLAAHLGKPPAHLLNIPSFQRAVDKRIWNIVTSSGGGGGAVSSVFGRTGAVVAATNDYTFSQIGSTPTSIAGYGIADAVSLTGIQTLTNKTLTSPIFTTPALGTPASGILTSCTGLPISTGVSGLASGVATFLATPNSANLTAIVTDGTGTGSLVLATSPTLVTPTLGVAACTSLNKVTLTAPATSATLTLANGSTLATSGAFSTTFTATATTALTLPTSGSLPSVILSGSASGAANVSISLASYYNLYSVIEVHLFNVIPATNSANLLLRTSTDGSTYDSSSGDYAWALGYINNAASSNYGNAGFSTSDVSITLATGLSNSTTTGTTSVTIKLYNPSNASNYSNISMDINVCTSSTVIARLMGSGSRLAAQVTKGIQFLMSTGNISCSYRVIGYI